MHIEVNGETFYCASDAKKALAKAERDELRESKKKEKIRDAARAKAYAALADVVYQIGRMMDGKTIHWAIDYPGIEPDDDQNYIVLLEADNTQVNHSMCGYKPLAILYDHCLNAKAVLVHDISLQKAWWNVIGIHQAQLIMIELHEHFGLLIDRFPNTKDEANAA